MKHHSAHILVFARYPVPGKAKTRLIPALGPGGSARLHRRMTEHAVAVARAAGKAEGDGGDLGITVCCTGGSRRDFRAWLGTDLRYMQQPSGDLGARMRWAFGMAFDEGAASALVVGSDVPGLTSKILFQAFEGLRGNDMVLGRAHDGGYYLMGMKSPYPGLFEGIDWGTGRVYGQTCDNIRRLGLRMADLPSLGDVDRPEDLILLREDRRFTDVFTGKPLVSIIIPTLNESPMIGPLLHYLGGSEFSECIVADGGSDDDTRKIAARAGAKVLGAPKGRAFQQNAGAAAAGGRFLLFLHADTWPPRGFSDIIRETLDHPAAVAGAFRFKTDDSGARMRLVEWVANLRSVVMQYPYGDQGLFMEKRVFHEMGGFAPLSVMEDFDLVRRLGRRGRVVTLSQAAVTSARRWRRLGMILTTVINQFMILGFLAGIPTQRLQRFYRVNGK